MSDIPISYVMSQSAATATASAPKNTLDPEGFLKLLIAQLSNQDPSSPMDTQAMVQQTTQLSMMEQMVSMAKDSQTSLAVQQRTLASQMVGAQVVYVGADGNNTSGTVQQVIFTVDEPTLVIDGVYVPLSSVAAVSPPVHPGTTEPSDPDGTTTDPTPDPQTPAV